MHVSKCKKGEAYSGGEVNTALEQPLKRVNRTLQGSRRSNSLIQQA